MNNIKKINIIKGLLFLIPFFYACNKEKNEIGVDLLAQETLISVHKDSTNICSLTTEYDTEIRSSRFSYMLGGYTDPITGTHTASFISRYYFDSLNVDLRNYTIDSICFVMYDTSYYYGDAQKSQSITIAELQENLSVEIYKNYYANTTLPVSLTENITIIGEKNYTPQFNATKGFRYKFQQSYNNDTTKQYLDTLLIQEFKGLYVFSETEDAAIVRYVSPQIYLYIASGTTKKTVSLLPSPTSFEIEDETDPSNIYLQSLSIFTHDFSEEIKNSIGTSHDSYYVQGNAGLKTSISFSNLESWQDSIVAINSAILHVPIANQDFNDFPYPPLLNLRIYNPSGNLAFATLSVDFDST